MPEPIPKAFEATFDLVTRRAPDAAGDRRIRVSVASNTPVDMGDGEGPQVLVMTHEACDLDRARRDAVPFIRDHNHTRHLGIANDPEIRGGKLHLTLLFGSSADAREVYDDMTAGVRPNISIGYRITKTKPQQNGAVHVTRWELIEVSSVSAPADPTVGVGRSITLPSNIRNMTMTTEPNTEINTATAVRQERERNATLRGYARHGVPEDVIETAINDGTTVEAFKPTARAYADARSSAHRPITDDRPLGAHGAPVGYFGERREFNPQRAIAALLTNDREYQGGFEAEWQQEAARRMGRTLDGNSVLLPPDSCVPMAMRSVILSTGASDMIGTEHMGGMFIPAVKAKAVVAEAGATIISGMSKDGTIPGLDNGSSTYWLTGDDDAPTDSAPTARSVPLVAKFLATTAVWSRKMVVQSDPAFLEIMRADMLREIAGAVDRGAIAGTGLSNQPLGIIGTAGAGSVEFGTDGGAPTWAKIVEFIESVEDANLDGRRMSFLTNAKVKAALMTTPRVAGHPKFILDDENVEKLAGFRFATSGNVPSNGTKGTGTNLSAMIWGDFEHLLIGQHGPIEAIIDNVSMSAKGNVRISIHSAWSIAVRHAAAFAVATDIDTSGA